MSGEAVSSRDSSPAAPAQATSLPSIESKHKAKYPHGQSNFDRVTNCYSRMLATVCIAAATQIFVMGGEGYIESTEQNGRTLLISCIFCQ